MKKVAVLTCAICVIAIFVGNFFYESKLEKTTANAIERQKEEETKEKNDRVKQLNALLPKTNFTNIDIKPIKTDVFNNLNNGEKATIVFLGDSTTEQNFQTNGKPVHVGIIKQHLEKIYGSNIEIINAGHSGDSIKEMAKRLEASVISHDPDLVIINSGLNDVRLDLENSVFEETYKKVIEDIKKKTNAQIILRTSNVTESDETNERLEEDYNPIVKKLAEDNEIGYIDLYQYYKNVVENSDIDKYNNDVVHPNENGQKLISEIVLYSLIKSSNFEEK